MKTPIAKLYMGTEISGLKKIAAAIIDKFNKAGVKAATANLPKTLRTLAKSAVREIKIRYGKVIFNNSTDKKYLSESRSKPGAKIIMTKGEISIPIVTTTPKTVAKAPNCALRNLLKLFRSCFSLYSVKTGTNAFENAPSAKNLRNKFGILNEMKKASVEMLAPNRRAINISLIYPSNRERRVIFPIIVVDRNICLNTISKP
tara:strand:- start:1266 stop:1871 length:606 start_codon:yes stop_codon:yes gene_type:complete